MSATTAVTHPRWCNGALCVVNDDDPGAWHRSVQRAVNTTFGSALRVSLWGAHDDPPQVTIESTPLDDEDDSAPTHVEVLEPEEARLLARRLLDAATWCEAERASEAKQHA
jgi:hypothetical protein